MSCLNDASRIVRLGMTLGLFLGLLQPSGCSHGTLQKELPKSAPLEDGELTDVDDPELMDIEGARRLISEIEARWPSHGPTHLQAPTSLEHVLEILKLDQVSLFEQGITFAKTQKGLQALALEAQIELAWGESYLTVLEIMLYLSEELEEEKASLSALKTRTVEQQGSLEWMRDTLARTDRLAQAAELLSIEHLTRGAAKANELISTHPDSYLGYRVAADYYRMVADWAKFDQMEREIEERNPNSNGLVFQRGAAAHRRSGDISKAESYLRAALAKDPAFVRAQAHLVAIQPHITKMHTEYQVLETLNPDHMIVHLAGESIERAYARAQAR